MNRCGSTRCLDLQDCLVRPEVINNDLPYFFNGLHTARKGKHFSLFALILCRRTCTRCFVRNTPLRVANTEWVGVLPVRGMGRGPPSWDGELRRKRSRACGGALWWNKVGWRNLLRKPSTTPEAEACH